MMISTAEGVRGRILEGVGMGERVKRAGKVTASASTS